MVARKRNSKGKDANVPHEEAPKRHKVAATPQGLCRCSACGCSSKDHMFENNLKPKPKKEDANIHQGQVPLEQKQTLRETRP